MKLLAIDSSAKSASVAVTDGEKLLSECFVNVGLTHSATLMPMVNNCLLQAGLTADDIDVFCVNAGPGSFTGIRIGVAAVKGLAFKNNKPCSQVSTLESMAHNFTDVDCTVCAAMDARCNQVYTALFKIENGKVLRLNDDEAISIDTLKEKLSAIDDKIYLVGDGAEICYNSFGAELQNVMLAGEFKRYQRAYGVALAAINSGEFIESDLIAPVYLRPPQAERELKLKLREEK